MDLKKIDLDKLQDYAFTPHELATESMVSNQKFINFKCLDNESLIPTVKAIPIPDNATNGDMIKAMFPDMRDEIWNALYDADLCGKNSWWNAPYKRGNENE